LNGVTVRATVAVAVSPWLSVTVKLNDAGPLKFDDHVGPEGRAHPADGVVDPAGQQARNLGAVIAGRRSLRGRQCDGPRVEIGMSGVHPGFDHADPYSGPGPGPGPGRQCPGLLQPGPARAGQQPPQAGRDGHLRATGSQHRKGRRA